MLKKLLTVALVLMLVVGVAGIASARCYYGDWCKMNVDVEVDIDFDLDHNDLEDLADNNVLTICQDGARNDVALVDQYKGGNLLVISQDGYGNEVACVWQDNITGSLTGYNIATIQQDGYGNTVGVVIQTR